MEFVISGKVLLEYTGPGGAVRVPEGVQEIADRAFYNRPDIVEAVVPEGVTAIGTAAFAGCRALRRLTLPSTLEKLGDSVISRCDSLEELIHPRAEEGVLYDHDRRSVVFCVAGRQGAVVLEESVVSIHPRAFDGCRSITEIKLPQGLRLIGTSAFRNCTALTRMDIPGGVNLMWGDVFQGCSGLRSLRLGEGTRGLHMRALRSLSLRCIENESGEMLLTGEEQQPNYVSTVDEGYLPLEGLEEIPTCYKPTAVACFLSSRERYSREEQEMYDAYISRQAGRMLTAFAAGGCIGSIKRLLETGKVKPAALKKVLDSSENKPEVTALLLQWRNAHVNVAKEREKEEKKQLRELTKVETPLQQLKKLFTVKPLPDGTLMLAAYMGEEPEVTVPAEMEGIPITVIGSKAFSPLKNSKNKQWKREGITKVTLPEGIQILEEKAFAECKALKEILLPNGLAICENEVFLGCSSLEEIALPDTLRNLGAGIFENCTALRSLRIPEGVQQVPFHMCYFCVSLEEIILPDTVAEIGTSPFYGCKKLTQLPLPGGLTKISHHAFAGMEGLTEVTVPGRIGSVGDYAFWNCCELKEVTFCQGVKSVTGNTFAECKKLVRVVLPKSVSKLGDNTFLRGFNPPEPLTLYVPVGSYAESYAQKTKMPYEVIGKVMP